MKRGGAQWRTGSDTCVYKPAVPCPDDNGVRAPNSVSRIREKTGAADDIRVENLIKTTFPKLVSSGVVTVHTKACIPAFGSYYDETTKELSSDLASELPWEDRYEQNGCKKVDSTTTAEELTNMITPAGSSTLWEYLAANPQLTREGKLALLRPILNAAVEMVPDKGPCIIHADCHLDNVLMRKISIFGLFPKQIPSLADWGRTVIVDAPITIETAQKAVVKWVLETFPSVVEKKWEDNRSPGETEAAWVADNENISSLLWEAGSSGLMNRVQHPAYLMQQLAKLLTGKKDVHPVGLNALRGWLPYVLVSQVVEQGHAELLTAPSQAVLKERVDALFAKTKTGGMYWPLKYSRGLTRKANAQRKRSATRRTRMSWKDPKAYVPWKSDMSVKTRRSSYTSRFRKRCPTAKTLPEISKCTRVPVKTLRTVYNRGMAAWRTGHRPGASQHAWGMARVHSFVLKGKTYRTADKDLATK